MECVLEVIAKETREKYSLDYDPPVMLSCPCEKCGDVNLDGPVISLEDV
jgi:hypothetical protein